MAPIYRALGNHDVIEFIPRLEAAGVQILLNETISIKREDATIYICGVDDPCFYQTHDLAAARRSILAGACFILLTHGPADYARATFLGYNLMLSGHAPGGQICLSGGFAPHHPGKCPRRMVSGVWRHGSLQGFTSRGTGSCGVVARFNCFPEVALYTLHT